MAVTYTIQPNQYRLAGRANVEALISYAAEPYSAGLPVVGAQLGMPNILEDLVIESGAPGNANLYKFDPSTNKIRIYTAATGVEVTGNQTLDVLVLARGW